MGVAVKVPTRLDARMRSATFGGMPTHTFTDTFGLPQSALAKADKPDHTLFIVEPS